MKALPVLHVNTEQGYRGGEIQNLFLAEGLARRGHRCVLAVPPGSGLGERALDRGLDVRERTMKGEFDAGASIWLAGLLRSERPDIVHYHTSHAVALGTWARTLSRHPPAVATRRTSFPTKRNPLFRLKFTLRIDRLIAVSGSIREDLIAAGIPSERIAVIHSGIDLRRFVDASGGEEFRRELGLRPNDFLVGCVGALAAQKGHLLLLEAVAALAPSLPELHVALVGEGELQARLLDEARGLGIGDRIHLTGFRDDVPLATAAFDLAVLPSVAGEGSPATVKEAMAAGVPVIATDIGGVREILEDGRQGLVISPGNAKALQAALRMLIEDAPLRDAMGQAGRERAREFSMERMIEKTEDVYASLCEAGQS